ncbi:hypothetical protein SETIT_3G321600v2 [Setaria italica]|uniref:Uncharacterized protein n=1 Tax=Setaria italica TaxID=4555 RepID=A0A368QLC2_SETIT|nr:hypothetical protein SETIT_3G321600v2 [Setaria italica]
MDTLIYIYIEREGYVYGSPVCSALRWERAERRPKLRPIPCSQTSRPFSIATRSPASVARFRRRRPSSPDPPLPSSVAASVARFHRPETGTHTTGTVAPRGRGHPQRGCKSPRHD